MQAGGAIGRLSQYKSKRPRQGRQPRLQVRMMSENTVTVTIWPLAVTGPRLEALHAVLSADEQARAGKTRVESAAREFIVSRGVARELLAAACGCAPGDIAFATGRHGKPLLERPLSAPSFNLSHSGGFCALAIGSYPHLGVDIEEIRPTVGDLARSVLTPREAVLYAAIEEADRMRAFFRAWVAKEAYLKATGDGLAGGLTSFELDITDGPEIRASAIRGDTVELSKWRFQGFGVSETIVGAVAVETGGREAEIVFRFINSDPTVAG
jgi:4'-phosphopantetheinyl transferase